MTQLFKTRWNITTTTVCLPASENAEQGTSSKSAPAATLTISVINNLINFADYLFENLEHYSVY